jgi:hypothetical protein
MTTPIPPGSFGRGLRLEDGDLVLDGGRLAEMDGVANLVQALTLRVLTPSGSDRFNTGYGLDLTRAFAEPGGIRAAKELIKLSLVGTLGTDPRVREVKAVTFDDDPERVAADPEGPRAARLSRTWTVEIDLETVTGTPVTLLVNVEV